MDGKEEKTVTSSCLATAFSACVWFTLALLSLSPPAESGW